MSGKLTQPKIEHYYSCLQRNDHFGTYNCSYDEKSNQLLGELFTLLEKVAPIAENGAKALWLRAERGPIEDYGNAAEEIEEGNYNSEEEFVESWKAWFPNETKWYHFSAIELKEEGYRAVMLCHRPVIVQDKRRPMSGFPYEISDFAQWLVDSVKECLEMLKAGTYNKFVRENLPPEHRIGIIRRQDYWNVWPEQRTQFFENISMEDRTKFIELASSQESNDSGIGRMQSLTANDFYRFCAMGYAENHYDGCDKSPKEQYYLHADGRDDGLGEIDPDDPKAFAAWHRDKNRFGGHPWEVCRGGNSTHVYLGVAEDEDGYFLYLAGAAWTRTIETVKFYLALSRAGIPVFLNEAQMLVERLRETEKIGIVPEGVFPAYCSGLFPNEHIICFMNLPDENREDFVPYCTWYDETEVFLK